MKLSVFTTTTRGQERGDTLKESLDCYKELADEVVVVGDYTDTEVFSVANVWPKEFSWDLIGQQFQRGYEACSGDWVIHADLDFIFHERDFRAIRMACENNPEAPALSFWKFQFVLPDRYNLKSRLVVAVNKKKFGDRIKFDGGGESDLCQPSLDGKLIKPGQVPEAGIPLYNYEKILKTKAQIMDDVGRMERAYKRHFGTTQYGTDGTDEDAFNKWVEAQKGKFKKPQKFIKLSDHPIVMRKTIKNLEPNQWGFSGLGNLEINNYAKN